MLSTLLDEKLEKLYGLNVQKPNGSTILKSKEVKEKLKISDGKLQTLRVNGILKGEKIGGTYYYNANDVNRLVP